MSKFKKIVLIFLLIIIIILGGTIWWLYQNNVTSRGDLLLELIAPETVIIGQPVEYTLRLKNQGNFTLTNAELLFEFPRYAQPIDPDETMIRRQLEEDIYPGQEQQFVFQAKIFGQEKEILTAKAKVDYRVQGLKTYYTAETSATTVVSSIPLTLELSLPQSVAPDEDFQFSINYFSTLSETLENVGIKISTTKGFQLIDSVPKDEEPGEWQIPFLISQDGGRIRLVGQADSEIPEIVFNVQLGVWTEQGFATLKRISRKIEINEAPIHLSFQANGSFDYVANPGDSLHCQIYFRNIAEKPLEGQFLTVSLSGDYLDLESLRATEGTYQPGHNSILWDWRAIPELRFLDRDEEGQVDFWVDLKEEWPVRSLNPQVELEVEIGSIRQVFTTKINSRLELVQKVYANDEFFDDIGPIPLKLNETTKYTVFWELKNTYNLAEDIWVAVELPEKTMFADMVFPEEETEKLFFSPEDNRLTWEVGQLEPEQKAVIAFQLVTIPHSALSLNGILIGSAEAQGKDAWTGQIISTTAPEVREVSEMSEESPFN